MYLDSAYIAKFYVNERDSTAVREVIRTADSLTSSSWALGEVACSFHRHMREGSLSRDQFRQLLDAFLEHVDRGVWSLIPVSERILRRTAISIGSTAEGIYLRAADAIHLATAQESGDREVWTNDRHMLAAASHFGLIGRSV
jgi:predicted nucleic acid-binding protein